MFSNRLPMGVLARTARGLATMLEAGVPIHKAFRTAARKSGHPRTQQVFGQLSEELANGNDVSSAMQKQGDAFPNLMIDMVGVAEQTGALPEVLKGLANHYENMIRLRRNFIAAITWPVLQLLMAVFIIAGLIWILGMIAQSTGGDAIDVLGWGLTGTRGALLWLGFVFGGVFSLFIFYKIVKASLAGKRFLDSIILAIPVLGSSMRAFAVARFAWAFHITQEAGMKIQDSITASMNATSNGAFIGAAPMMNAMVEDGEDFSAAMRQTGLFPFDLIEMVIVAETSGTVPEMLDHMGPQFEDDARRKLEALASALGWLVWAMVAGFIIFVIFSVAMWYLNILNGVLGDL